MRVSLFIPCLVEHFQPEVGIATARVLAEAGMVVDYPQGQTCCGQPMYKSGHINHTTEIAKRLIALFENSEAVVCPSGSCVAMVKKDYPVILKDDPVWHQRAEDLALRVHELSQFLVNTVGVEDLGAKWKGRAVFHDSCQASRVLGIRTEPRRLLSKVEGLELLDMERPELCCGFGGLFSVKFPDLSIAMVRDKISYAKATGADWIIGIEPGCILNMAGYLEKHDLGLKTIHLAEVLAHRGSTS